MRSDQTQTIVIIVLAVLMVIFAVFAFYFGSQNGDLAQQKTEADNKASEAQSALGRANTEVQQLKEILGYTQDLNLDKIREAHEEYVKVYGAGLPGEREKKGYVPIVKEVIGQLETVSGKLREVTESYIDLDDRFKKLEDQHATQVKSYSDAAAAAEAKLQSTEEQHASTMAARKKVQDEIAKNLASIQENAEKSMNYVRQEAAIANKNVETLSKVNNELTNEIQGMKSPYIEKEDGRIISVNQLTGRVVINLGAASGLRPGTTFGVFDPENLNMSEAVSKGNIEVVQLLGPDKSEARILGTVITNPIQYNDLIYTPVWKPGLHPRFVLSGKMLVSGFGSRASENTISEDDLEDVIKLIMANGGVVDYYTDSNGKIIKVENDTENMRILSRTPANFVTLNVEDLDDKEKISKIKLGDSGDVLRQDTAFLVKGQGDSMNHTLMTSMKTLDTQATINGIREITLPELLRRMGWRNATPSRGYGNRANETDIEPKPTKPAGVSRGTVSQLYTQQQGKTIDTKKSPGVVSPLYSSTPGSHKTSPGTVSPLYHKDRKPVNQSSGTVSGFYGGSQ